MSVAIVTQSAPRCRDKGCAVRYRRQSADPDASYNAHKRDTWRRSSKPIVKMTEAVAATPDLITHVEVHKMTVRDGHRLADALI